MGTITVANAAELSAAIAAAKGGDTIVLRGGNYGELNITSKISIDAPVKIMSESETNPAIFTGMALHGVNNIKIEGVKFDYVSKYGDPIWTTPFGVYDSKNVSITKSTFDGDVAKGVAAMDNGFGTGRALYVTGTEGFELANNKIFSFNRAAYIALSKDVNVTGNEIKDISSDGLDFSEVQNVLISQNHIHDFRMSATTTAHPDMIQFWTTNTKVASSNIRITDNLLDQGAGSWTQTIFMRNELVDSAGAGTNMYYRDIVISNNVIRNNHYHGITVGEAAGLTIQNNSVLPNVNGILSNSATSINVAPSATNVNVSNNISLGISFGAKSGWSVANNYIIQKTNPAGADYVGNIFADVLNKYDLALSAFKFIPGTTYEKLGVGSMLPSGAGSVPIIVSPVVVEPPPVVVVPPVVVTAPPTDTTTSGGTVEVVTKPTTTANTYDQSFDASNVLSSGSKVNLAGATAVWDFGDGHAGTGILANHVYETSGTYTATVNITLATGKVITATKIVVMKDVNLLDMDFSNGLRDNSTFSNTVVLGSKAKIDVLANGNKVLDLNGGYVTVKTDPSFQNNSEYTFVADFKKDAGAETQWGRIAYFNGSLIVTVKPTGIEVNVHTTKGMQLLKAENLNIKNTDWHRVGVTFSGETGFAKLYLDGKEVASIGGLQGSTQFGYKNTDLIIGSPFGTSFDGKIDNIHMYGDVVPVNALTPGNSFNAAVATNIQATKLAALNATALVVDTSPVQSYVDTKTPVLEKIVPTAIVDYIGAESIVSTAPVHYSTLDSDFRLI
jgi:parallel beta-helix repeat protein